jgi:hypothetical protein
MVRFPVRLFITLFQCIVMRIDLFSGKQRNGMGIDPTRILITPQHSSSFPIIPHHFPSFLIISHHSSSFPIIPHQSSWGTRTYEDGGGDGKKEDSFVATWAKRDLNAEPFRGESDEVNGVGLDGEKRWGGVS